MYADLHKTDGRFYLTPEEAKRALENDPDLRRVLSRRRVGGDDGGGVVLAYWGGIMTIKKEYRVTVEIPEDVWISFQHATEFEQARIEACRGHLESGCDFYSKPFEWAIFDTYEAAHACEEALLKTMGRFQAKLVGEPK